MAVERNVMSVVYMTVDSRFVCWEAAVSGEFIAESGMNEQGGSQGAGEKVCAVPGAGGCNVEECCNVEGGREGSTGFLRLGS